MKRRAVSEILSAIIIIIVVVAGLGIYTGLSQQRILGDANSVKETIIQQNDQISELLTYIDMFANSTNNDVVSVYVHNFGIKNIIISELIVNGTTDMSIDSRTFYVRSLDKTIISPDNKTLPLGKTSEIVLDFDNPASVPERVSNIVIKTDSNKIIQIVNSTS